MPACLTIAALALLLAAPLLAQQPEAVYPASNQDRGDVQPQPRPYEMDWAGRTQPEHPQLVDFEDLEGWTVACYAGAQARIYRSKGQQLFGEWAARLVYTGQSAASWFRMQPPAPIPIPGEFNAVNLWMRGNNWGWINPPQHARVGIYIVIEDAKGARYRLHVGQNDCEYWFLLHQTVVSPTGRLLAERLGAGEGPLTYPARFIGVDITGVSDRTEAELYLDALSLYKIEWKPLSFEPIPDKLPWPTTPDTILPTFKQPVTGSVEQVGQAWVFTARGADETVRYRYAPEKGSLDDLLVEAHGQRFQPCAGGGIVFDLGDGPQLAGSEALPAQSVGLSREGNTVSARWRVTKGDASAGYELRFTLRGKSLVIDAASSGGSATEFRIGAARGLRNAKLIFVPYLTVSDTGPRVVSSDGLFVLGLMDWYNSDASLLFSDDGYGEHGEVRYNGGGRYGLKTDGTRNDLRERFFLNVSSDFHEVLPNIPNPKSDTMQIARDCVWRNIGTPQPEMLRKYHAYGIENFISCLHEVGWRDAGESFTMRLRAAPRITDQGLQDYSALVRGIDAFRFGTYTNYVDFAPVNENWNEDDVCLDSNGEWQRAWPRCYALKPLRAAEKEAYYAPRINEKFHTTAQYCDVHTAYAPWGRTDYDARAPGAGMFRTQFNAFARLLHNESKAHQGPVFSEGRYQWYYAGIVDGDYGQMQGSSRSKNPPLVDFDLLKMHPLMTDFGMGMPDMFFDGDDWRADRSRTSPHFDRFHTSTIAFGHIGFLADEWGFDGTLKSYYMLQAVQRRYIGQKVVDLRYADEAGHLLPTSEAVAKGVHERGQVYVKYANGLQIWANLSFEHDWLVVVDGAEYLLTPGGHVCRRPKDMLQYSAIVNGQHQDLVRSPDYVYLDTRGRLVRTPWVTTRGTVAIKRIDGRSAWVIPATEAEEVSIADDTLPGCHLAQGQVTAKAVNEAGEVIGQAEVHQGHHQVTVMPFAGAIKYRLASEETPRGSLHIERLASPTQVAVGTAFAPEVVLRNRSDGPVGDVGALWDYVDEADTAHEVGQRELGHALAAGQQATLKCEVRIPPDAVVGKRLWYRVSVQADNGVTGGPLWFDVTALSAVDITLEALSSTPVPPGSWHRLGAELKSNWPGNQPAQVVLTAPPSWQVAQAQRTLSLAAGQAQRVAWEFAVPAAPTVDRFAMQVKLPEAGAAITRWLKAQPSTHTAVRLTDVADLTTGVALRGGKEQPLDTEKTGAQFYKTLGSVGGVQKQGFFCHPPYKTGVGYAYGRFKVRLPEQPSHLRFFLGFLDGSSTQDGCEFKVIVSHGGKEQTVFDKQHAKLGVWEEHQVDLSEYAGQEVELTLLTDVGPADDSYSDWALWGEPDIVLSQEMMSLSIHETEPPAAFLPPPQALKGLTQADLAEVAEAKIVFESAGLEGGGQYVSYGFFNSIPLGKLPPSTKGDEWGAPGELALTQEALRAIKPVNSLVIRNPGGDCFKVRRLYLWFRLADGREGTSWVAVGPYTSAKGWQYEEGESVPAGQDLPPVALRMPLQG